MVEKEKTVNVTMRLPESQIKYLDQKAIEADTNRSQITRKIIREHIANEEAKVN